MKKLSLTVVICTHNRADLLHRALTSLHHARRPDNCDIRILVIANACKDHTVDVLRSWQHRSDFFLLRYYEEPRPGKSRALNLAIRKVETNWMAFVDDDHRVDPNYLTGVVEGIDAHPEASMLCGRILPDWTGEEPGWVHDTGPYRLYPLPIPNFELGEKAVWVTPEMRIPGGGNLVIHQNVFQRVGDFSTQLGPDRHNLRGGEDSDFVLRALGGGERLCYLPSIVQYHHIDPDRLRLGYLILKSFQRSYSITLARHPHRNPIPPYQYRKLLQYCIRLSTSFNSMKFRFHLMRIASTLGEMLAMPAELDRRSTRP